MYSAPAVIHAPPPGDGQPFKVKKRIIVCCDGTWEDGNTRQEQTNIIRLSRAIKQYDERTKYAAVPQIVFYQAGIGSVASSYYSKYVQGPMGGGLAEKVEEAYVFIAQNFHPGDEIFLFGFSRGAYTARMIAMFIGAIGILGKADISNFAEIFLAHQNLGKSKDPAEIERLRAKLGPWTSPTSRGKLRAISNDHTFSIRCVGVFDTVISIGLPAEIPRMSPSKKSIFGFSNTELGEHIERAYQALAIDENRVDFDCVRFEQTEGGRRKGQVLKQCWFSGQHGDIGGGWNRDKSDLSFLTLSWLVANISDIICVDLDYIRSLLHPVAPWGKLHPHSNRVGASAILEEKPRQLPTRTDNITHETIHSSVLERDHLSPRLREIIQNDPSIVCGLLSLEEEIKRSWPYVPGKSVPVDPRNSAKVKRATNVEAAALWNTAKEVLSSGVQSGIETIREIQARVAAGKGTGDIEAD